MRQCDIDSWCENLKATRKKASHRIYGVGKNDLRHASSFTDETGKRFVHSGYRNWTDMMARCFCEKYKTRQPTYKDVTCCEDWSSASKFVDWQRMQYREDDWQLDKDLLVVGNKVYSPETCIYIPRWLNNFITGGSSSGKLLKGVSYDSRRGKYYSNCSNPVDGKSEFIGSFSDEFSAHQSWKNRKLELLLLLKPEIDALRLCIYPNIVKMVLDK